MISEQLPNNYLMKHQLVFLFALLFLVSCEPDLRHMENLAGDWRGVSWTKDGEKSKRTARALIMRFDGVNLFAAHIGGKPMKGKYRLNGNRLYLTPHEGKEESYKIEELTPDSLFLNVTNRGMDEKMVFIRKYKGNITTDKSEMIERIKKNNPEEEESSEE